jgi:hypothetical protein
VHDKHSISPNANDASISAPDNPLDAGENGASNAATVEENGTEIAPSAPYFMCGQSGSSAIR